MPCLPGENCNRCCAAPGCAVVCRGSALSVHGSNDAFLRRPLVRQTTKCHILRRSVPRIGSECRSQVLCQAGLEQAAPQPGLKPVEGRLLSSQDVEYGGLARRQLLRQNCLKLLRLSCVCGDRRWPAGCRLSGIDAGPRVACHRPSPGAFVRGLSRPRAPHDVEPPAFHTSRQPTSCPPCPSACGL